MVEKVDENERQSTDALFQALRANDAHMDQLMKRQIILTRQLALSEGFELGYLAGCSGNHPAGKASLQKLIDLAEKEV